MLYLNNVDLLFAKGECYFRALYLLAGANGKTVNMMRQLGPVQPSAPVSYANAAVSLEWVVDRQEYANPICVLGTSYSGLKVSPWSALAQTTPFDRFAVDDG